MLESEIIFEGVVDGVEDYDDEGSCIMARICAGSNLEFELEIYSKVFPIPANKLKGGEIFYVLASGCFVLPTPPTAEEIEALIKHRSKELDDLFARAKP